MKIHGIQKMTLLDFPGKVACTVFLGGCNFRCPFCHNFELVDGAMPPQTDDAALLALLERRRGLLDGVCVTGGEPTLHAGLPQLLRQIKALGFAVKLDTNGTNPAVVAELATDGLVDYVAMDLKNSPERYAETVGLGDAAGTQLGARRSPPTFEAESPEPFAAMLDAIRRTAALILDGKVDGEFRTTVVAGLHDADSIRAIGSEIRGAKRYFLQPFVDRDTVPERGLSAPDDAEMDVLLAAAREFVPNAEIRGR